MIVAAGLSPAFQQLMVLETLQAGEVNRAREVHWFSSGKVLNVGLALHHLGGPQRILSLFGGRTGERIRSELQELGVDCRWVAVRAPTRVCTTLLDQERHVATELVQDAEPVNGEELSRFREAFVEEASGARTTVLTGSLPRGAPRTYFRDLLAAVETRAILDIRGKELDHALEARPFLVKPNREELAATVGRALVDDARLVAAMHELNGRGATWAVVTDGTRSAHVTGEERAWRLAPLRVAAVNPIGCGDCLAAGIAWSVDRGSSVPEAVAFGIACAAQNAATLLPSRLDRSRAEEDAARVIVQEI